jgi:hypothetical protein
MSIGIRHLGKVIGWILTTHETPEVLNFFISYMNEQYRGTPFFLMAYATIVQLQVQAGITYIMTSILSANKPMLDFMENAFENRIESRYHKIIMIKNL